MLLGVEERGMMWQRDGGGGGWGDECGIGGVGMRRRTQGMGGSKAIFFNTTTRGTVGWMERRK